MPKMAAPLYSPWMHGCWVVVYIRRTMGKRRSKPKPPCHDQLIYHCLHCTQPLPNTTDKIVLKTYIYYYHALLLFAPRIPHLRVLPHGRCVAQHLWRLLPKPTGRAQHVCHVWLYAIVAGRPDAAGRKECAEAPDVAAVSRTTKTKKIYPTHHYARYIPFLSSIYFIF